MISPPSPQLELESPPAELRGPLIVLPDPSLVLLVGCSSSGKSTFARRRFAPHEIVSSDFLRAMVANDENVLDASDDAFEILLRVVRMRLERRLRTVVDATNVLASGRAGLRRLARDHGVPLAAIVFQLPVESCLRRHDQRPDRWFDPRILQEQYDSLLQSIECLEAEGFAPIRTLTEDKHLDSAIVRWETASR